jgi:hypothetical protein
MEKRKKQEAHEVARDATAWAIACLGSMLSTTCSLAWARLDPISVRRALRHCAHRRLTATVTAAAGRQ